MTKQTTNVVIGALRVNCIYNLSLAPDPFFIFLFFLFLLFFFFFLRGHNTCIACRIFVYFSQLARKKGFCSAIGNLKLD